MSRISVIHTFDEILATVSSDTDDQSFDNSAETWTVENESAGAVNGQLVQWPFDPAAPPPADTAIQGGEYVSVYGSIVTDKAHPPDDDPPMADAVRLCTGNNFDDEARWTEIHPPDWIQIVRRPEVPTQTLRGVTVVAPGTFTWWAPIETSLDVDILAPPRPSADAVLRYREIVGPETVAGAILEGNADRTAALVTPLTNADGIHVHVRVAGSRSLTGGSAGKFRALYWLYGTWLPRSGFAPDHPFRRGLRGRGRFDR